MEEDVVLGSADDMLLKLNWSSLEDQWPVLLNHLWIILNEVSPVVHKIESKF